MKNKKIYAVLLGVFVLLNTLAFQNCSGGKFKAILIPNSETLASTLGDPVPTPSVPVPNLPANMKSVYMAIGHSGRSIISCDDGQSWINDQTDTTSGAGDHGSGAGRAVDSADGYFYSLHGWGANGLLRRTRDGVTWETIQANNWGGGIAAEKNFYFALLKALVFTPLMITGRIFLK